MARRRKRSEVTELEVQYQSITPLASRFADELTHQVEQLLNERQISLGFPIQRRLKTWESIKEKLNRKSLNLANIIDLQDLVGLRIILQFQRDVQTTCEILSTNFDVLEQHDSISRLSTDQFGYSSVHFILQFPESWLAVPTLAGLGGLRAEVQVRTIAQHLWATASHTLQYKQEGDVPVPIRRAIHRVSALLETVDLEFERVLGERANYRADLRLNEEDSITDVDVLEKLLDSLLPPDNKEGDEDYSELLSELRDFDLDKRQKIIDIVRQHLPAVLKKDRSEATAMSQSVYYTHAGLLREVLGAELGGPYNKYLTKRYSL